jgi:hypothetical protein
VVLKSGVTAEPKIKTAVLDLEKHHSGFLDGDLTVFEQANIWQKEYDRLRQIEF